jgi:hypothetical protein
MAPRVEYFLRGVAIALLPEREKRLRERDADTLTVGPVVRLRTILRDESFEVG